jgi:hypothetical protein
LIHFSKTFHKGHEDAMQSRNGRVGVIVIDLLRKLPQSIDDAENVDALRAARIAGLARKTDPNGSRPINFLGQAELNGSHQFMGFHPHGISRGAAECTFLALVAEQGIFTRQGPEVLGKFQILL